MILPSKYGERDSNNIMYPYIYILKKYVEKCNNLQLGLTAAVALDFSCWLYPAVSDFQGLFLGPIYYVVLFSLFRIFFVPLFLTFHRYRQTVCLCVPIASHDRLKETCKMHLFLEIGFV